jgi:hypothetical protein
VLHDGGSVSPPLTLPSRAELFLGFSHCFVLLVLYCPFLHHILKPFEQRSPSANSAALRCVEAAIEAIRIADAMEAQGMLYEAYAITVDIFAMAATSLLVVELGAPGDVLATRAKSSSSNAKSLLENLASRNCSAARCLESLTVSSSLFSTSQKSSRSRNSGRSWGSLTDDFHSHCTKRLLISQELLSRQPTSWSRAPSSFPEAIARCLCGSYQIVTKNERHPNMMI